MTGFDAIGGELRNARLLGQEPGRELRRTDGETGEGFGAALVEAIRDVDELGKQADATAAAMYRGEPVELHDLMIAMGKSEVAFNLMLEVRNKLVEAWQTLSRSVV